MTRREPEVDNVFSDLGEALGATDIVDVLDRLVEASTSHTSAIEAGIVLKDGEGTLHVVASTSERSADLEEAQLGTRQGPCFDCVASGEAVEVADVSDREVEWPDFSRLAEQRGFRAVHATPMRLRRRTLGSLCLFSTATGPLSDREAALVQTLADAATLSILQQHVIDQSRALADQLQHALDSRIIIEQAKGALAQRRGISVDEAFVILRRESRNGGRPLRQVAAEVIEASVTG